MTLSITWFDEIGSTQTPAFKAAHRGDPEGGVWATDHQTAGRGRWVKGEKRAWLAPPQTGVMFSILLRPDLPPSKTPSLTLAIAVACARALEQIAPGVAVRLKWPNDLYIGDRKLGGILTEGILTATKTEAVIVGVGINVNMTADQIPEPIADRATSLRIAAGRSFDRLTLLTTVVAQIREVSDAMVEHQGLGPLRAAWSKRSMMTGRTITLSSGESGVFTGLAEDGGLVLSLKDGSQQIIRSGELTFD